VATLIWRGAMASLILSRSAKGGDAMVSETKVAALRVASAERFG